MWLLPIFSLVANLAARVFYRLRVAGPRVPPRGPLLLVANHSNALLDPALVAAAARRPVRFLAKAPLFEDPLVGWLVRGAGAIPVYRRADDPSQMERNRSMFRAAHEALGQGAAIGLFPEGTSHSEPSIQPLKTGAARLALGATRSVGGAFPVVPVGLVFRQKERFRSRALIVFGEEIEWRDLAASELTERGGPQAGEAEPDRRRVHELTRRIDDALRRVTVNLERWEDEPLLRCAEAIWRAETTGAGGSAGPSLEPAQIERLELASRLLAERRRSRPDHDPALVQDLEIHAERLNRLGLSPALLTSELRLRKSIRWTMSRLYLLGMPALLLATVGYLLYWIPFRLTDRLASISRPTHDQTATYKLLIGAAVYSVWVLALSAILGVLLGLRLGAGTGALAGVASFLVLPWVGMAGLWIREHWRGTARDLRQFLMLRSRKSLIERLRRRQQSLAVRIRALVAMATPATEDDSLDASPLATERA